MHSGSYSGFPPTPISPRHSCWYRRTLDNAESYSRGWSHCDKALGSVATRPPGCSLKCCYHLGWAELCPAPPHLQPWGRGGRHVQIAVSASCLGLGHLLLVAVGGVRGAQQPNLLHGTDGSAESSLPSAHILSSVQRSLHRGLALLQLLAPTTLLGEPLLCFCLLCVCALPFSPCPQASLCNVR